MTRLTCDLRDDSSIHASGRRAVTAETSRAWAGLRGGRDDQGIKTHPESLECRATGYIICLQESVKRCPGLQRRVGIKSSALLELSQSK
ncbi:hypothetical protein CesoFtcFv8_019518 [Champsocephalus esox]|uniref:Uncharacterized protein n=1 Tax=Champsocephalus esox TaxID=159716 RepID=A0AAN8BE42_9TELE|nr:hypothetical protein CesoFtcFv8_019518 [Champsocephalus esox]